MRTHHPSRSFLSKQRSPSRSFLSKQRSQQRLEIPIEGFVLHQNKSVFSGGINSRYTTANPPKSRRSRSGVLRFFFSSRRERGTMLLRRLLWKPIPFPSSFRLSTFSSSTASRVLRIGDVLRQSRRFSDVDVLEYSKLSHDFNPLHFDSEIARDAGFEDRLVHGMLVASLFPRIIASHFPGAVYVSQSLKFKSPVYFGDEVVAEVQAVSLRQIQERYIVKFSTKCFKSGNLLVLDGEAMATLPTLAVDD